MTAKLLLIKSENGLETRQDYDGLSANNPPFTGTLSGQSARFYDLAGHGDGVTICDSFGNVSRQTIKGFRDATLQVIPWSAAGIANGVAELDPTGRVPSGQLPSYVDDVVEVANFAALPGTGEVRKIYITLDDNKTWRWSGTAYAEISASLALGETSATAYRGDRGKIAYDHSQATGNPHATTPSDIGAAPLAGAEVLIHSDFGRSATTDVWQSAFTNNTAAGLQLAANSTASGTEITIEQAVVIPADASGAAYQFYIGPQLTGEGAPSGSTYAIVLDPSEAGGYGQGIVRIKCELIGSGSSITGYVTSTFFNNSGYPPTVKFGTITVNGTIANSIDVRFNPQSVTSYVIRRNRVRRCNP